MRIRIENNKLFAWIIYTDLSVRQGVIINARSSPLLAC